jgi:hypothetical protein
MGCSRVARDGPIGGGWNAKGKPRCGWHILRALIAAGLLPVAAPSIVCPPVLASHAQADTVPGPALLPTRLVLEANLSVKLRVLADGLHNEIVLCLYGRVESGTAHLTRFSMPTPRRSSTSGATFERCPTGALATWHNHPRPPTGIRAPRSVTTAGTSDLCRLSDTDVRTASRHGHPFTIVAVSSATWCWWRLDEVRRLDSR